MYWKKGCMIERVRRHEGQRERKRRTLPYLYAQYESTQANGIFVAQLLKVETANGREIGIVYMSGELIEK
jgi:hypothetical protein